jgi:hypothetical protein
VPEEDKIEDSNVYKYYILIPTRTSIGTLNIRPDNPYANTFCFLFDRVKKSFSMSLNRRTKQIQLVDQNVIVLEHTPGAPSPLTSDHMIKMYEWVMRPSVDMEAIKKDWYQNHHYVEHEKKKRARLKNTLQQN